MKIDSGVNTNSSSVQNSNKSAAGKKEDSFVTRLQRQITNIEEQKKKLSENDEVSAETKATKLKEYTQQIADLNKQITEHKMEVQKQEQQENADKIKEYNKNQNPKEEQEGNMSTESMDAMILASTSMSQVKSINHVKTQMSGEAHQLKGNIAAIKARGEDPGELQSSLEAVESKIADVTTSIVKIYGKANKKMKEAADSNTQENITNKEKESNSTPAEEVEEKKEETKVSGNLQTKEIQQEENSETSTKNEENVDNTSKKHVDVRI